MTGLYGLTEGKEMAIRRLNLNYPIFSANRHFFPPFPPESLSFRASARNLVTDFAEPVDRKFYSGALHLFSFLRLYFYKYYAALLQKQVIGSREMIQKVQ